MISKNTICLWYDSAALEAATFYAETFPDSAVLAVHRAPGDYPSGKEGDVLTEFRVMGIPCLGLNGGPAFRHSEAFLPGRHRRPGRDRPPVERHRRQWRRGKRLRLVPRQMGHLLADHPARSQRSHRQPDRAAARRAFEAMMTMGRIDIATIEKAFKG